MDVLMLSRLQFAAATMFHFIFVPLSLGLALLIAVMETIYVRTGDEEYKNMAKFWGKIFLVNFGVGVVTGITLEFQFGTNWSGYSKYVGDIFGSLLAIEATTSFFLESTFIAIWLFGWKKLSPKVHALCIWLVAIASSASAYWILAANAWMQHPVGYVIQGGRAELTDFWAVMSQPFAIFTFLHTVMAGYLVGAFFVMGVSAYHLLRNSHTSFFTKSFKLAMLFGLIFSLGVVAIGDLHGKEVAAKQPIKVAAMEAQWETQRAVPFSMMVIPDEKNERNYVEAIQIPKFMSWLVFGDWNAEFKGLKEWPKEERPPVTLVFVSFRLMVGLGFLFIALSLIGWVLRDRLQSSPLYLLIMMWSVPLPFIASQLGWMVTEVGRQPWIVYGVMKTSNAVSTLATSQVAISLAAFVVLYSLLGLAAFVIMIKIAKKGPEAPGLA
ncbi:cytochrome ubiquinol oxidase subunit I [Desulfomonile tiedjei]|uniref:Cytochrome bd-type quinol oxidase, subunit 1 n=1 Tax=Desulfomonile tiedjei (strain ATCC 49306 / DSM 6799 / DCB-1) TaxID=706587 RepID=I4CBI1_DESTA|nr:cytochrome ubiquinol oxidase subunit I [Desulfomonile tiedjei]AFM26922.1 cytochrome bd-type quinol oxidase, subunit 1 [Desulfomonile tiedjei DSM 6799]